MPRAIKVDIGTRVFAKKGDAVDHFKAMLSRYAIGQRVSELDQSDLHGLLRRHIDYDSKVGVGVDYFVVMDDGYGWKCFGVVRKDGTLEDFTYRRCISQIWER